MTKGFWEKLALPIVGMSPMDGVTDAPWRFIAKKYGIPDVVYTEFVSAEGLWRIKKRGENDHRIWKELTYDESERPVVAQLFGSDPLSFYEATKIICSLEFDGVDINMGCPSPGLEKSGGGAGLIRKPELAKRVIEETRRAVKEWSQDHGKEEIPVTFKTRIGSSTPDPDWWKFLASMEMPVVAMHGRTFKQLYSGEADWEILKAASEVIKSKDTLFLANGDIKSVHVKEQDRKSEKYLWIPGQARNGKQLMVELVGGREIKLPETIDGVLIGRAAMGNPWVFRKDEYKPTIQEKLQIAIEHSKKFEEIFEGEKFLSIRKHLAWYAHGFENASVLRSKLVQCNNSIEVNDEIDKFLKLENGD